MPPWGTPALRQEKDEYLLFYSNALFATILVGLEPVQSTGRDIYRF